jgi:uncharacterized coiled-coil DUF342 family protein
MAKETDLQHFHRELKVTLEQKQDAARKELKPLYDQRDALLKKVQPLQEQLRELQQAIKKAEQPLRAAGNDLATLARAAGSRTMVNEGPASTSASASEKQVK